MVDLSFGIVESFEEIGLLFGGHDGAQGGLLRCSGWGSVGAMFAGGGVDGIGGRDLETVL